MFITISQRHQLGSTWKWVDRKCQLHVQRHRIWNRIFVPSNFAWRKTIRGRGESRMSQKVRCLSRLLRNINTKPHENMQKGSVQVPAMCSKSQNLASCTWPSKFAWHTNVRTFAWHTNQEHQFGNTWKWAESFFFFGMSTSECRIHVEKLIT